MPRPTNFRGIRVFDLLDGSQSYEANINVMGTRILVGYFDTLSEAIEARELAEEHRYDPNAVDVVYDIVEKLPNRRRKPNINSIQGVHERHNKNGESYYVAHITLKKKFRYLGSYSSLAIAYAVRKLAEAYRDGDNPDALKAFCEMAPKLPSGWLGEGRIKNEV